MDIYIIIGELESYHYRNEDKLVYDTRTDEKQALEQAILYASGDITIGGTNKRYKLSSIVKFNAITFKAEKLVLELSDGKFKLRPFISNSVPPKLKNS